jgi:hypothetical protein
MLATPATATATTARGEWVTISPELKVNLFEVIPRNF